jgi:hypothetical protein
LRRRLKTVFDLPGRDRRHLFGSCLLLPMVEVSLRVLGFQRTLRLMEWRVSRRSRRRRLRVDPVQVPREDLELELEQVESTVQMVIVAARHGIHKASCLRRAMVAWYLLQRQGIATDLRIGVRKDAADAFEAHAWVEYQGMAIADPEARDGQYIAFDPLNVALSLDGGLPLE